jgi:hypothetical protein
VSIFFAFFGELLDGPMFAHRCAQYVRPAVRKVVAAKRQPEVRPRSGSQWQVKPTVFCISVLLPNGFSCFPLRRFYAEYWPVNGGAVGDPNIKPSREWQIETEKLLCYVRTNELSGKNQLLHINKSSPGPDNAWVM